MANTAFELNAAIQKLKKYPCLQIIIISLIFSTITSLNLHSNPKVDELIYDNQYYATLAMNFALGRGYCYTKVGDCAWETVTPEELSSEVIDFQGDCIATNTRAPLGPVVLGLFLKLADYDLLRAIVWYNFVGLLLLGFYLSLIMKCHFDRVFAAILILIFHFILLPTGYTTLFPTLVVNVCLVMLIYHGGTWFTDRDKRRYPRDIVLTGIAAGLLMLARPHFTMLIFLFPVFLILFKKTNWSLLSKEVTIFLFPIIMINGLWIVRNGTVLDNWSHTTRGIQNFYYRTYENGDGRYFLITKANLVPQLEEILGPLPESIKANVSFENRECKPDRHPEIIFVPKELNILVLKAALIQIRKNPANYLKASIRRLKAFWQYPYPPLYNSKAPLFQNNKLQKFILNPVTCVLLAIILLPLRWYNILFLIALGLSIYRTEYGSNYLTLAVITTLYNVLLLVTTSVAAPSYSAFTWSSTLIAITCAYYWLALIFFRFAQKNLSALRSR